METTETKRQKLLTPEQLEQEIRERNEKFQAADEAGKRVLIAQDVINQLAKKTFEPRRGNFFKFKSYSENPIREYNLTDSLQKIFLSERLSCHVCALGALMMSTTIFNNKSTVYNLSRDFELLDHRLMKGDPLSNEMDKFFSKEQLFMIEIAFEKGNGRFKDSYSLVHYAGVTLEAAWEIFYRCENFTPYGMTSEEAMIKIMQNIIDNNGEFKP